MYSTPNTRHITWHEGGIAFLERQTLIAIVNFPKETPAVGSDDWESLREAWIEYHMLPDGAYWPKALPRNPWSKDFILEER